MDVSILIVYVIFLVIGIVFGAGVVYAATRDSKTQKASVKLDIDLLREEVRYLKNSIDGLRKELEYVREKIGDGKKADGSPNKIAELPPDELSAYLNNIFFQQLELVADSKISTMDHAALEKLYGRSLVELINYLGEDTIDAIDSYYGNDYVQKYTKLIFEVMEKRNYLTLLLDQRVESPELLKVFTRTNKTGGN